MSSRPLLNAAPEYVDTGSELERQIGDLRSRVTELEHRLELTKRDAVVIVLNLLAKSLKRVASGEFDIDDVPSSPEQPSKWDAIKKRLAPRLSEAIDILSVQGGMRRTQLAAAMKMDYSNCTKNVIAVLVRQGLVVESGGQLSLKEL